MDGQSLHTPILHRVSLYYSVITRANWKSVLLILNRLKNVRLTTMHLVVEFLPASSMWSGLANRGSLWNWHTEWNYLEQRTLTATFWSDLLHYNHHYKVSTRDLSLSLLLESSKQTSWLHNASYHCTLSQTFQPSLNLYPDLQVLLNKVSLW